MMSCTNSLIMRIPPVFKRVEYRITGNSNADITLSNKDGLTVKYENVSLPCSYSYDDFQKNFAFIQAKCIGNIMVQIIVNGDFVKQSTGLDIAIADYYIEEGMSK